MRVSPRRDPPLRGVWKHLGTKPELPNIGFINADDLTHTDLSVYGGQAHTPNFDRLAAEGLQVFPPLSSRSDGFANAAEARSEEKAKEKQSGNK